MLEERRTCPCPHLIRRLETSGPFASFVGVVRGLIWRMGVSKGRKEMGRVEGGRRTKRRGTEGKKEARQWKPFHANLTRDRPRHLQRSSKPKQVRPRDVAASSTVIRRCSVDPPCVCIVSSHQTKSITTPPSDSLPQPQHVRISSPLAQSCHTKLARRRETGTRARDGTKTFEFTRHDGIKR